MQSMYSFSPMLILSPRQQQDYVSTPTDKMTKSAPSKPKSITVYDFTNTNIIVYFGMRFSYYIYRNFIEIEQYFHNVNLILIAKQNCSNYNSCGIEKEISPTRQCINTSNDST